MLYLIFKYILCISKSILLDIKRIKLLLDFHVFSKIFSDMHSLLNIYRVDQTTMSTLQSVFGLDALVHNHGQFFYHPSQNHPHTTVQNQSMVFIIILLNYLSYSLFFIVLSKICGILWINSIGNFHSKIAEQR